jgi:hypothetical protein
MLLYTFVAGPLRENTAYESETDSGMFCYDHTVFQRAGEERMTMQSRIHWGRVVAGAFLVEIALIALTIPVVVLIGMEDFIPFVPPVCFGVGLFFGWWTARKVESLFVLHGTLVGIIATLIYFGLIFGQSGSIMPVVAMYGPFLFVLANALRILGCMAGGAVAQRRQRTSVAAAP